MNKAILSFILGAGVGSALTYFVVKDRFNKEKDEEVKAVRKFYRKKNSQQIDVEAVNKLKKSGMSLEEIAKELDYEEDAIRSLFEMDEEPIVVSKAEKREYEEVVQKHDYTRHYAKQVKNPVVSKSDFDDVIELIDPNELGDEYETYSYTYYADKVLTDSDDEPVENVAGTVSYEALEHFGDYEDDSVFVRNHRLKMDIEILLDNRNYSDVALERSHPLDEYEESEDYDEE